MNYRAPALMLLLGFSLDQAYAGMIDKEGMAPWEICGMCHGLDGNSHMAKFPKLAGQKADYIVKQFSAFRAGIRTNDGGQMQSITEEVQDQDLAAIADYFASQAAPAPNDEAVDPSRYALGRSLFDNGRNGLPACSSCHQPERQDTPWLDAQHAAYLDKQLNDFRSGARDNDEDAVMWQIASELQPAEQDALVHYLSHSAARSQITAESKAETP